MSANGTTAEAVIVAILISYRIPTRRQHTQTLGLCISPQELLRKISAYIGSIDDV